MKLVKTFLRSIDNGIVSTRLVENLTVRERDAPGYTRDIETPRENLAAAQAARDDYQEGYVARKFGYNDSVLRGLNQNLEWARTDLEQVEQAPHK